MTTFSSKRPEFPPALLSLVLLWSAFTVADELEYNVDGHVKARLVGQAFPDDSVFNSLAGSSALDMGSDFRLNFEAGKGAWSTHAAYQLFALYGDQIEYSRDLPSVPGLTNDRLPNDDRRLFDLTDVIRDEGKFAALQRLDRLWLGYTSGSTVVRIGRQAITWGNGFFFSPMDIVNPFDPTAIDTEYKAGDDMIYGQYLRQNGHDVQAAVVFRRDPLSGDVESAQSTMAAKYHGIVGNGEFDILVADNYGDTTIGVGMNRSIGGAVWRGDVIAAAEDSSVTFQVVTNFDYSWTWRGKNMSGVVEYYYNGYGIKGGRYDEQTLAENPELLQKIARGELFTLGRNYLAGGVAIEMTPLWTLTPNAFINLDDQSAFLQLVTQYSLGDNLTFLGAINIPTGPDGTEYAGIPVGGDGEYLSTSLGLFAQIAWYF